MQATNEAKHWGVHYDQCFFSPVSWHFRNNHLHKLVEPNLSVLTYPWLVPDASITGSYMAQADSQYAATVCADLHGGAMMNTAVHTIRPLTDVTEPLKDISATTR